MPAGLASWIRDGVARKRASARLFRTRLWSIWLSFVRWLRVLWVVRVSTTSVIVGFVLMTFLPQARDVFADTSSDARQWTWFFVALFWFWAVPVHYAARRALAWEDWAIPRDSLGRLPPERNEHGLLLPEGERRALRELYERPVKWIPRALGVACFLIVLIGLSRAADNLAPAKSLAQARKALDLIDHLQLVTWALLVVFVLYFLFRRDFMVNVLGVTGKAGMADYTWTGTADGPKARRNQYAIVDGDLSVFGRFFRNFGALRRESPADFWFDTVALLLLLGITLLFVSAALRPHELAGQFPRAILMMFMLGAWVPVLTYVSGLSHRLRAPLIAFGILGAVILTDLSVRFHDVRNLPAPTPQGSPAHVAQRQKRLDTAIAEWKELHGIDPKADCLRARSDCPRPIVVAGQGGASRAAFFTATVLGHLLDVTRNGPDANDHADFGQRLFAISSVSGSSLGAVVFRAALEDASDLAPPEIARPKADATLDAGGRAFPIRAGAPETRPSTDDEKKARRDHGPCDAYDKEWFAYEANMQRGWRNCLQAVLAGDFLSPVFVGLGFRDHLSLARGRWREPVLADRAALLEEAWERRYAKIVGSGLWTVGKTKAEQLRSRRLEEKFGYHGGKVTTGSGPAWMPLLFLNGSSVNTGRRIVVTDAQPWYCGSKLRLLPYEDDRPWAAKLADLLRSEEGGPSSDLKPFQLYSEAYDFFELSSGITNVSTAVPLKDACARQGGANGRAFAPAADISLSTAATMSARFPIISPHGVVRNLSGDVTDLVVDGGYFENDGLVTAADIAKVLMAHGLRPVIVRITNEPETPRDARAGAPDALVRPPPPRLSELGPFQSFIAPLLGLYQTRAGHGVEAAKAILDLYDRVDRAESDESDRAKYLEIKVYDTLVNTSVDRTCAQRPDRFAFPATLAEISMSWWLSQPVQEFLNMQLCHERNLASLEELRTTLKKTHKKNYRPEGPAPATTQKQVEAFPETASAGSQP